MEHQQDKNRLQRQVSYIAISVGLALLGGVSNAAPVSITVSPEVPADIPGGASQATLAQAAAFAWQEFIALNWPALGGQRDVPDIRQPFGSQGVPLVWHTYRSKVEIFPGKGSANVGPPGYKPDGAPSYGYGTAPTYDYSFTVPACSGQIAPKLPAWINLDESTQIGLDQMYAGVVPATPTGGNSNPQLVRFLAKANQVQYTYVAANQFWYANPALAQAARNFFNAVKQTPPTFPSAPRVNFPNGTIEVKSAWRQLGPGEDPSRFHRQTVRFYEQPPGKGTCYFEAQWAMVALHIIQKTPTAPSFIYATFEQADNILLPSGKPLEDENGRIINPAPGPMPTNPGLSYQDDPNNPQVKAQGAFCKPGKQLYLREIAKGGTPAGGPICINQRYEPIAADVIQVNQAAHQAIQSYSQAKNIKNSPWQYYKLVSVQAQPFDTTQLSKTDPSHSAAVYYQANIMVETDYTLQQFRGRIAANGAPTSFQAAGAPPPPNVFAQSAGSAAVHGVNMGGCMGCHGNAQVAGFDFSFILKGGNVRAPETAGAESAAAASQRYLQLFTPSSTGK